MWPGQNKMSRRSSVRDLVEHLRGTGHILERTLPQGAGKAIVLSAAGARYLSRQSELKCFSGKDFGETGAGGHWTAPLNWRHELLAAGVLSLLVEHGWTIKTEREIRRAHPGADKLPDGLAMKAAKSGRPVVLWLEVERAKKEGDDMRKLTEALVLVGAGKAPTLCGWKASAGLLAYPKKVCDPRGYAIDHHSRVIGRLKRRTDTDFSLLLAPLRTSGQGVDEIELGTREDGSHFYLRQQIDADRIGRIVERFDWSDDGAGTFYGRLGDFHGEIWPNGSCWAWQVERVTRQHGIETRTAVAQGSASIAQAAMRRVALATPDS